MAETAGVPLGMLEGVRVLDLAGEALAYAGRVFAGLGADVILVEPPEGAASRRVPPLVRTESGSEVSAYFAFMGAGKRSVTLDVSTTAGEERFERLLGTADIVLLPDGPALDVEMILTLNPRLIAVSVSGFGLTGPRRSWRSSDLVAWAASGAALSTGDADRPPIAPGGGLAYAAGALNAAVGAMLALRARQRTGRGQLVDISLQEAAMSVSMEAGLLHSLEGRVQRRGGRRNAAHGLYRVQDGYVEVVAYLPAQWDAMASWIVEELGIVEAGLDTFRGEPMNRQPFIDLIDTWVAELAGRYTKQEYFFEAQRRRIPCGPVNDADDVLGDPHLDAVGAWGEISHPDAGTIRSLREPVKFDGVPLRVGDVPSLGAHNDDVLGELV